jgi:hypothetical protein
MMGMWFTLLVPFFVMMVLLGNRTTNDEKEVGNGTYPRDEEEMKGGDETDSDDGNKPKESSTPFWKYVIKLEGGKGGGTTKFTRSRCNTTYSGSYTRVRKHLCEIMPSD